MAKKRHIQETGVNNRIILEKKRDLLKEILFNFVNKTTFPGEWIKSPKIVIVDDSLRCYNAICSEKRREIRKNQIC